MYRIRILQKKLQAGAIDLAIIMQPRDLYYYAGTAQPCNLLIPAVGEPLLFVRRAWDFVLKETRLPYGQLVEGAGSAEIAAVVEANGIAYAKIGLTEDVIPASIYKKMLASFPNSEVVDISPLVLEQRMVKECREMEDIIGAADLFRHAHNAVLEFLRPGVTEIQISAKVLESVRRAGGESIIRNRRWDASLPPEGLVVSTTNMWRISGHAMTITGVGLSNALPWGASHTKVITGDLLVVDMGINLNGYQADIARTYVVGKATSQQLEVFNHVLGIQQVVLDKIKPGVMGKELYSTAAAEAKRLGQFEYFQGYGKMKGRYIGHGIGLELDEPPTLDDKCNVTLVEGMALAIEPKLIIPQFGGIVIEDDVFITPNGYHLITPVERCLFEVQG